MCSYGRNAWNLPEDGDNYYIWDTSEIPAGDYYIYALIWDNINEIVYDVSEGPVTINHEIPPENVEPFIEITEPDGDDDVVNKAFTIEWEDYDTDSDAFISLYYDINSSGYKGTLIVDLISEDGKLDEFLWDTTPIPDGKYYIYAIIADPYETVNSAYSYGPITIDHTIIEELITPEIQITSPVTNSVFAKGEEVQFDNYYFSKETYEWALRTAGFKTINWHKLILPPEIEQEDGKDFWEFFIEAFPTILIECEK